MHSMPGLRPCKACSRKRGAAAWLSLRRGQTGSVQQRQELAFSLHSGDLVFNRAMKFFGPRNILLMNSMEETISGLPAEKHWSAPLRPNPRFNTFLPLRDGLLEPAGD